MNAHEESWAEAQVRTKVEPWCHALRWRCKARSWYLEIQPTVDKTLFAYWSNAGGKASVAFFVPISTSGDQFSPWPPEVLLFVLRRNANLAHMHWCITRYDGLCVTATRELDTLSMDGFRELAEALMAEVKKLLELAGKELEAKEGTKP